MLQRNYLCFLRDKVYIRFIIGSVKTPLILIKILHCVIMDKQITIDTAKTYTKSEYSRAYNVSRPRIDEMIKTKELTSIKVKGATLIIAK